MNQIKKARIIAGLTQEQVAKKIGVTTVTVCKWETGQTFPNVRRLKTVADVLNVPIEKLVEERAM